MKRSPVPAVVLHPGPGRLGRAQDGQRRPAPDQGARARASSTSPRAQYLKPVTFGFSSLAADLIFLWAIQYYGNPEIPDKFEYFTHIFSIIAELDPRYVDPYEVGALIAIYDARDVPLALSILDLGLAKNPGPLDLPVRGRPLRPGLRQGHRAGPDLLQEGHGHPGRAGHRQAALRQRRLQDDGLQDGLGDLARGLRHGDGRADHARSPPTISTTSRRSSTAWPSENAVFDFRARYGRNPDRPGRARPGRPAAGSPAGLRRPRLHLRPADRRDHDPGEPMETMILVGLFGLSWGSFLNVVIYRLPRGLNLSRPPSACPACGARIKP